MRVCLLVMRKLRCRDSVSKTGSGLKVEQEVNGNRAYGN